MAGLITLYDAARCPYCARTRIVLAEKGIAYETVEIDLSDRPAWLYEMNPAGKVPVLEEDGWILPESAVIDEYLNERYPEPPLWPDDPGERAAGRLLVFRFDDFSMDGMRVDVDGNLYITRHGKGTVAKVSPEGRLLREIRMQGSKPSNICFGGPDGRTAYVTLQDRGAIETFRVESPGREWRMVQPRK